MLSVLLLGAPQLAFDQQPVHLPRRKSRALVYYLAAHGEPLTREHLLSFFWPDTDRAAAQQVLRTMLHGLRRSLGTALLTDEDRLALAPDTEVDVRRFEADLTQPSPGIQRLTTTLDLYRGDFLENVSLPDSSDFEIWLATERERYRRLAVRGLAALSRMHETDRDYPAALDALDRALAFDPLQEDLQRIGLRLHYLTGDRVGAIRRYEHLRRLLDEELGVPPMLETRSVYDAIITDTLIDERGTRKAERASLLAQRSSALMPQSDQLPFSGRAAELQRLRESSGAHKLTLIEGEPGIGKTRLAEEFMRASAALCLTGKARELEQALPYHPIVEALRGLVARPEWPALRERLQRSVPPIWLAEVTRLAPELAVSQQAPLPTADEPRLWEGVHQLLVALARDEPVVVFVDDLQWADASTLGLIGYLIRQAESAAAPVRFLATARSVEARSPLAVLLQTLTRESRLERLSLTRLGAGDVVALAERLSPAYAYPLAEWLTRASEGNPYILAEMIRYARENDILRPDRTVNLSVLSASPIVPQTVYTLIQSRLARLSDAARRVLDAAVAAGREFEFELVARAVALSESAALDALDELRAAGLVYPSGATRYAFDHHLTMEVAYREVGELRHRRLHRRIAEAIESVHARRGIDPVAGLLAWHFSEGDALERAAPYALRAGQLAAGLAAWKEAIAFYEQALAGSEPDRLVDIHLALGDAQMRTGEFARASDAYRAALTEAEARGDDADASRLALGQSLLLQSRFAEAIELAQQVLASGRASSAAQAESLWGTALSLEGADLAGAVEHLHAAETHMSTPIDVGLLAQIKFELGSIAAQQGDLPQAVALYRAALTALEDAGAPSTHPRLILAYNNLAYHLHLMDDPGAVDYARTGLRLAEEAGELGLQTYLRSTLGEIALAREEIDTAEKHFSDGLALAERFSSPERIAGLTANLGRVAHARGQAALAIHRLSTALARADALGTRHLAAQIRVWLAPLLPPAEARAQLGEARTTAESSGYRRLLEQIAALEQQASPLS